MKDQKTQTLIIVIVAAAILISGSLIFLGIQMNKSNSSTGETLTFAEQLENYQKEMQEKQAQVQKEAERAAAEKAKNVPVTHAGDHVKGNKNALVTIYEYSDFECPYCKRFYLTPDQLVKNNKGKVNTVFRHFPLSFHDPIATKEALAAECASDQGKFWEYHDEIFKRTKSNKGLKESDLAVIAKDLNLKVDRFTQCLDSEKYLDKVKSDIAGGADSGVTGTPGSIIKNNKTGEVRFISGAYPIEAMQAAIDELLA